MSGLIQQKHFGDLILYKYKKKVFFDNLWNEDEMLLESRGMVTDHRGSIKALPLKKVFNYGENDVGKELNDDSIVIAIEKINGFMLHVTKQRDGSFIIGTTGSLDSEFVDLGKRMLEKFNIEIEKQHFNCTYVYEICSKEDEHIINEIEGVYLLAVREFWGDINNFSYNLWGEIACDYYALKLRAKRPSWKIVHFGEILEESKYFKIEGWMIRDASAIERDLQFSYKQQDHICKLKTKYYLTKKWIQRSNSKKVFSPNAKEIIDEEYYELIDYIQSVWDKDEWDIKSEKEKSNIIENFLGK